MKAVLVVIALIGLAAVAQAEKLPSCKTWVRSPKTCNIPAGTCCGDPYVCNNRNGDGGCVYPSSQGATTLPGSAGTGASTLPGSAGTGATTLPGSAGTGATTLPGAAGTACPSSGCDRICPGQSRGGAPPCSCGFTFCSGKCIANDQADKRWQSEGKTPPPCKGA